MGETKRRKEYEKAPEKGAREQWGAHSRMHVLMEYTLSPAHHPSSELMANTGRGLVWGTDFSGKRNKKKFSLVKIYSYFTQHQSNRLKQPLILNQSNEWCINTTSSTSVGYSQRRETRYYGGFTGMELSFYPNTPRYHYF